MTNIHSKAARGIKLLMGRQVLVQLLTFVGGIILARKLDPAQFGLYGIATFLVTVFALIGDFGLAPSFIQRKNEVTERDLQVGFTMQQSLIGMLVVLLYLLAPWLAKFYPKAPPETVWLVRALAFTLFIDSWRTMSALQLERHLAYHKLAVVEVVETLSYQGIAVVMALCGFGVWSFVCAALVRGLLGTMLVYLAAPWKVRFMFDYQIAKHILKFGLPFQLATIINSVSGWVTPVVVASMIGPQAVGYLTWAASMGKKPLLLVDSVMRVSFPHFSRIQEDRAEVERIMVRYLTYLLLPAGIWFTMLLTDGAMLVRLIYTNKWGPAVPALIMCAFAVSLDVIVWVVSVTLNAVGYVGKAANRALVRTIAQIGFGVLLVLLIRSYGGPAYNGVPIAYILALVLTLPWTFKGLARGTMKRVLSPVAWVLIPMAVSALVGGAMAYLPLWEHVKVVLTLLATVGAYLVTTLAVCPQWLLQGGGARFDRLRAYVYQKRGFLPPIPMEAAPD